MRPKLPTGTRPHRERIWWLPFGSQGCPHDWLLEDEGATAGAAAWRLAVSKRKAPLRSRRV
jgi:hypothetical protein